MRRLAFKPSTAIKSSQLASSRCNSLTAFDSRIVIMEASEKQGVPGDRDTKPTTMQEKLRGPGQTSGEEIGQSRAVYLDPLGKELFPAPTSDPLDPLNWPAWRKYICILIVMYMYFLFTYITTTPVPSFLLLQDQFQATYTEINWTLAVPALGLATGPLFWSSFADIYGRRLIMILGTSFALVASGCTGLKNISYSGYMAARFFQGFAVAPAATVGLSIINDLSWEHERGFRVGLWVLAIDLGAVFGPLFGGFITLADQFWVAYQVVIMFAVLLIMIVAFLPETLYPRGAMIERGAGALSVEKVDPLKIHLKRTKQLPFLNIRPIPGVHHPKPWHTLTRFAQMWSFPTIVIPVVGYCFLLYWWLLSILTMFPVAYPDFGPNIQGLLMIGLILGTLISEIFISGRLSDWIVLKLARRNNNVRTPEMRLWLWYPAAILVTIGLIVWGRSIDAGWHWITGQIAWFLFACGIQIGNTVVSSYVVDTFPTHAMEVITFYSVILNFSAFAEPFFINTWVEANGYTISFVAQGIICLGMIPLTICLQIFGPRLRNWRGPPKWAEVGSTIAAVH